MPDLRDAAWADERERLLVSILQALESDPHVLAVWLEGSQGRGTSDRWSDIDLGILVADGALPSIRQDPLAFVSAIVEPILIIDAPGNAPAGGAYLLTLVKGASGPQQVDWYWYPATSGQRPARTQLLFARPHVDVSARNEPAASPDAISGELLEVLRNSILMAYITGKHIRRRNDMEAVNYLEQVAKLVRRAHWMANHHSLPQYGEPEMRPNIAVPRTTAEQIQATLAQLAEIEPLVIRSAPDLAPTLGEVRGWLETAGSMEATVDPPECSRRQV